MEPRARSWVQPEAEEQPRPPRCSRRTRSSRDRRRRRRRRRRLCSRCPVVEQAVRAPAPRMMTILAAVDRACTISITRCMTSGLVRRTTASTPLRVDEVGPFACGASKYSPLAPQGLDLGHSALGSTGVRALALTGTTGPQRLLQLLAARSASQCQFPCTRPGVEGLESLGASEILRPAPQAFACRGALPWQCSSIQASQRARAIVTEALGASDV